MKHKTEIGETLDKSDFLERLETEVDENTDHFRERSAGFLIWFLRNFFRFDRQDAIDSVCDKQGDKGIDGIWVDETASEEEIYIFQSKFSPLNCKVLGDTDLRTFVGSKSWFASGPKVQELLTSTANDELKSLIKKWQIEERVAKGCKVNAVFITNGTFDTNAKEYLKANKNELQGYDVDDLFEKYTYIVEEEAVAGETILKIRNHLHIDYTLVEGARVQVFPIQAKELLKLNGIKDNTLFSRNVRYGLGRTRVNTDIRNTLLKEAEHQKFFLYHNGITLVCEKIDHLDDSIKISNYSVINGCQSMLTFYENSDIVSDEVVILTKIIEIPKHSPIKIDDVTHWTNNQNAISVRDLKANDSIQRSLKREFDEFFGHKVLYRRQKGDPKDGYEEVIERDVAAQLIASLYLKEPNITYVRDRLFTDRYYDIFSININPPKIYLANVIFNVIKNNADIVEDERIRNYGLARFFMLYVIGEILSADELGRQILDKPDNYVKGNALRRLELSIAKLLRLVILDIQNFIKDWEKEQGFFDYKNFFKNGEQVGEMCQAVITAYRKGLVHHEEDAFNKIYQNVEIGSSDT